MPPLRRLALLYVPLLALLGFSLSRRPLATTVHTSAPLPAAAEPASETKPPRVARKRQPLVYVYDWFEHCASIGLCANASLDASREAACREAAGLVERDWVFVSAAKYLCASAGAYGRVTKASDGFVETQLEQFHIAALYDARLLRSEWRTRDPDAAALFYVPYDPSVDLYHLGHKPNATFSRAKHDWLVASVLGSPYFARHGGADHFLVVAATRIAANVAFDLLDNGPLINATKLNVELHGGHPKDAIGRIHAHVARSRPARTSVWAATVYVRPLCFVVHARARLLAHVRGARSRPSSTPRRASAWPSTTRARSTRGARRRWWQWPSRSWCLRPRVRCGMRYSPPVRNLATRSAAAFSSSAAPTSQPRWTRWLSCTSCASALRHSTDPRCRRVRTGAASTAWCPRGTR